MAPIEFQSRIRGDRVLGTFGGRHMECAYYFDFCRVVAIFSDRSPRPHCAGSLGRPRGRMVDSRAIFLAVLTIQASSPYGQPRSIERITLARISLGNSSSSARGQSLGKANGGDETIGSMGLSVLAARDRRAALDHFHSRTESQKPLRLGCDSMNRITSRSDASS